MENGKLCIKHKKKHFFTKKYVRACIYEKKVVTLHPNCVIYLKL